MSFTVVIQTNWFIDRFSYEKRVYCLGSLVDGSNFMHKAVSIFTSLSCKPICICSNGFISRFEGGTES